LENKSTSWDRLPAGEIFKAYLKGDPQTRNLFDADPFDLKKNPSSSEGSKIDPKKRFELLTEFNKPFELTNEQKTNLKLLSSPDTACVVTGQQLSLFGGPLYTFFKISTAILLARKLSKIQSRAVIPVFWMADEDHDFDEISTIAYPKGPLVDTLSIQNELEVHAPVSDLLLPSQIDDIIRQLLDGLGHTDFTTSLEELITNAYKTGKTHREAFGNLITSIFGKYGLVVAGSHHPAIKKALISELLVSVDMSAEIESALKEQSMLVEKITKPQAMVTDSLLFYLDPEHHNKRLRIKHLDQKWSCESGKSWTDDEICDEIKKYPERFSPNVFLRPIMQDALLPTLAYVAGPGEIAYYAQTKRLYAQFGQKMPVIYPRHSATLIEPGITRLMSELPFSFEEYQQRLEVLEKLFVGQESAFEPEDFSSDWNTLVRDLSSPFIDKVAMYDASLEASAQKVMAEMEESINRLTQKVVRSLKQKEQTSLNRIARVKTAFFPDEGLQERSIAGVYFMNKYGLDIWDRIIQHFELLETNSHHLVEL